MSMLREEILNDEKYFSSLIDDINHAKKSIDLEVYIFENDATGKKVADALCSAAKRGVKIRVLVDGVGSINWGGEIPDQMEKSGVEIRIFHPLPWKFMHWKRSSYLPKTWMEKISYFLSHINSRNHRKVCLIDKSIVYIGSANIIDASEIKWRDISARITGVNISELQYAFEKAWQKLSYKKFADKLTDADSGFHFNYSRKLRRKYYKNILNRVKSCKKRIWVVNAYFVPDVRLLKKLIRASQNGVDVRILLPGKSDIFFMTLVSSSYYETLLKSGIKIFEYQTAILHAKILILDDWISIGTNNLNHRSFLHDLEVDVEIRTDQARTDTEKTLLNDINHSKQIGIKDLQKQPFYKKIFGQIILLGKYWL